MKGSSRSVANTEAQKALIAHWQGIVKSLGKFLSTLKANHVSPTSFDFILLSSFLTGAFSQQILLAMAVLALLGSSHR